MTVTREREWPPPKNESPGAVPTAPGQSIPTQHQDKARKAALQGSTTAAPNWKQIAEEAWTAQSWQEAAQQYHANRPPAPDPNDPRIERAGRLLADNVSLERAWYELNRINDRAAAATVEALMFGLRDGIDALPTKPERLRRLWELSETQLHEVCARLQNFKPAIARPWTADEVDALVSIWAKSHE